MYVDAREDISENSYEGAETIKPEDKWSTKIALEV